MDAQPTRRWPRTRIAVELRARDREGFGSLQFDSVDLSAGGAFLRSDVLFEEGEGLELELDLGATKVRGLARVAWVRRLPEEGEPGMGMEFVEIDEATRAAIAAFLAAGDSGA